MAACAQDTVVYKWEHVSVGVLVVSLSLHSRHISGSNQSVAGFPTKCKEMRLYWYLIKSKSD
jgi:hypothetical protein